MSAAGRLRMRAAACLAAVLAAGCVRPTPSRDVPDLHDPQHPATVGLQAVLAAYGISVPADELARECGGSEKEGVSVDVLETVAQRHGLRAVQVMVPPEHLLSPAADALPAIVIAYDRNRTKQFLVAWRLEDGRLQILDPKVGRRRVLASEFARNLLIHQQIIPGTNWMEYARGEKFTAPLAQRMRALGVSASDTASMIADAKEAKDSWRIAALDAAVRVEESAAAGWTAAEAAPEKIAARLRRAAACARGEPCIETAKPPPDRWTLRPADPADDGTPRILLRGAVAVSIKGRTAK